MNYEIVLSFHNDGSNGWPHGYWAADARVAEVIEYSGVGATPLDAMTLLARLLLVELQKQLPEDEVLRFSS